MRIADLLTPYARRSRWLLGCCALLASSLPIAQDGAPEPGTGQAQAPSLQPQVTAELIDSKIKEVEASSTLDAETAKRLVEQYRAALSNLEEIKVHETRAAKYRDAVVDAPRETKLLQDETAKLTAQTTGEQPPLPPHSSLEQVEQQLARQLAEITTLETKLTELDKILDENLQEPNRARKRVVEANLALEEINAKLTAPVDDSFGPLERQARQWALETRRDNLRSEVLMLDQQILSAGARTDLNLARRTLAEKKLTQLSAERAFLENEADRLRHIEAERVKTETAAAEERLSDAHPLVRQFAHENAALSELISTLTDRLDQLDERQSEIKDSRRRIEEAFRGARQRLEAAGLSRALGQTLITQRGQLPDLPSLRAEITENADQIANSSLNLIRYRDQLRDTDEAEARVRAAVAAVPQEDRSELHARLSEQLSRQSDLLQRSISIEESYLRAVSELDDDLRALLHTSEEYQEFLSEHLLWVRSVVPITEQNFAALPAAVNWLTAPQNWHAVPSILGHELKTSATLWLGLPLVALLLWKTAAIKRRIRADGEPLRRVSSDRFSYTLDALVMTLLLALPWPLLLMLTGWRLEVSPLATPFSKVIGPALFAIGLGLYYLRAFYLLCLPGGLADRHFRWSSHSISRIRHNFAWATLVLPPIGFIAAATVSHAEPDFSGTLGRLSLVALILALAVFTVRLTNPTTGAFREHLRQFPHSWLNRSRILWYPGLIAVPIALAVLALAGYLYTAGSLLESLTSELWLILALVVVHQLIVRWLIIARRSLSLKAALERRASRSASQESEAPSETEKPPDNDVDLAALDEQTRRLINSMIVIVGAVGLWLIWSDELPALGILDRITLWHYAGTLDGVDADIPVTLADLGLLSLIVFVVLIAAKNLPALFEIILLRHTQVTPGMRYTVITLTGYVITAFGVLLVFGTLGLSWSQIQWLIAALSVGIGFGLQEIVANFISGLIILFERPIRVGDVVTIGDTTGMVTRIQIRATTIRNWDKQELLVPNKEFITGRLLNWTLTDKINRMTIVVGAEYGCDTRKALELLGEAAAENPRVLEDPEPIVTFEGFGDNSLTLVLRCYLAALDYRLAVTTELHQAIDDKFRAAGIGIAFPQRDIHLHAADPIPIAVRRSPRADAPHNNPESSGQAPPEDAPRTAQ